MIIDSVTMRNIRSYSDRATTVEFPEGTVLVEGDVGSGKSTILYAIEFALFGVSEMAGSYLLTEGKGRGSVDLTFFADGIRYTVHRGLKRGKKSITQEDCYIVSDGSKEELSPTDLKSRVVDILKFNEPRNPRAQSLIYRFAIFTPQERMKQIVSEDSASRSQTLRKVLGLEDYKIASDNSELVARRIRSDADQLRAASSGLEDKESHARELKEQIEALGKEMPNLEKMQTEASRKADELSIRHKELSSDREKLVAISNRIPELERNIKTRETQNSREAARLKNNEEQLAEGKSTVESFRKLKPPSGKTVEELKSEKVTNQREKERLLAEKARLEQSLKQNDELVEKGECPLCHQKIAPAEFGPKSEHYQSELRRLGKELERVDGTISSLDQLQESRREYDMQKEQVEKLQEANSALEPLISEVKDGLAKEEVELTKLRDELAGLKVESAKMSDVSEKISRIEEELKQAQKARDEARYNLTRARTQMEDKTKEMEQAEKEIKSMRSMRSEASRLANYTTWLSTYFEPTVQAIERQMLSQMNLRFSQEFKRFYSTLVEDQELTVRVDEEFNPIFERQSFAEDYDTLSGGERTSVALAYRLALNAMVQQVATSSAGELLILDEPTEGFSKGQLNKIRDMLDELKCKQVILVSHEKELESFADQVYRVVKENGESRVLVGGA